MRLLPLLEEKQKSGAIWYVLLRQPLITDYDAAE
jgi:hypothetical protein